MRPQALAFAALLAASSACPASAAAEPPVSGKAVPAFEPLDRAALKFMDTVGCQAATVAVSKGGRLLYSRGYGWADEAKQKPAPPDALMRIASVTKPITAAAVKSAVRSGRLSLDARAFGLIAVEAPGGKPADARVAAVTVGHLLEHKGGWDRDATFDPMFRAGEAERELGLGSPATPADMVRYMLARPLQFAPGERSAYSNFGYCVLGRVLEKATGRPYVDGLNESLLAPLKIKDIKLGRSALDKRDAREVWYPVAPDAFSIEVMDSHGGLIASAPALCRFFEAYWISGEPRSGSRRENWTSTGSMPGTTALVRQRGDGVTVAFLANGRRDKTMKEDIDELIRSVDAAVDGK